jgi:hypothetical protein
VIGADDPTTDYYNGSVLELLIFPGMSGAHRTAIRQNIAAYYGITL